MVSKLVMIRILRLFQSRGLDLKFEARNEPRDGESTSSGRPIAGFRAEAVEILQVERGR